MRPRFSHVSCGMVASVRISGVGNAFRRGYVRAFVTLELVLDGAADAQLIGIGFLVAGLFDDPFRLSTVEQF